MQPATSSRTAQGADNRGASEGHRIENGSLDVVRPALRKRNLRNVRCQNDVPGQLHLSARAHGGNLFVGYWLWQRRACYEIAELAPRSYPKQFAHLLLPKGSIALDGISLTINELDDSAHSFGVNIIPHTLEQTHLHTLCVGEKVNLEFDMVAKLYQRALSLGESGGISFGEAPATGEATATNKSSEQAKQMAG